MAVSNPWRVPLYDGDENHELNHPAFLGYPHDYGKPQNQRLSLDWLQEKMWPITLVFTMTNSTDWVEDKHLESHGSLPTKTLDKKLLTKRPASLMRDYGKVTPSSSMATTSTIYKFGWFFRSKVVSSHGQLLGSGDDINNSWLSQTKTREMTKMGATTALLGPWAM